MGRAAHILRLSLTVAAVWLSVAACGEALDRYTDVKDLRVLAMRADPPEVLLTRTGFVFSGGTDVSFTALVLDPRGGVLTYSWEYCPVESGQACRDYESQRAVAPKIPVTEDVTLDTADLLDAAHLFTDPAEALHVPVPVELRASPAGVPYAMQPFTVTGDVFDSVAPYYAASTLFGFGLGSWPIAVIHVARGDEELLAEKRVVVGLTDLGEFNDLLRQGLGFVFCSGELEPGEEDSCLDMPPRLANTNPTFAEVRVKNGDIAEPNADDPSWSPVAPDGFISLEAGESIRLLPVMTADSNEAFKELRGDLQTRTLQVVDSVETITVSWFVTAGNIQDQLTTPQYTKTLDTVYTAPTTIPEGGFATVWMVARDQRGGEAWTHVDVRITPRSTLLTGLRDQTCAGDDPPSYCP